MRVQKTSLIFLQKLNDLIRLTGEINEYLEDMTENPTLLEFPYDSYKNFDKLPKIDIKFTSLNVDFETQGRFMLLDTPGPNEARQTKLKEMLKEQLERSSAVMMVLDYTQLRTTAEEDVKEQINKIPTIQKDRLFALVNKFDQENANDDDKKKTINHVYRTLLNSMIEERNIYPISAQNAYLANRMLNYITQNSTKPKFQTKTWIQDIANKRFGKHRKTEENYNNTKLDGLKEFTLDLFGDSLIEQPLVNVVGNMRKNA
ncbi:MAG: hypothetical protein KGV43_01565, partial [Arcobacter sp.]|nr:hypothetical protein [Arcobacter sp.]